MSIVKNKIVYAAFLLVQLYLPRTCFSQNIDLCNRADNSSKIVVAGGSITEILFLLEKQKLMYTRISLSDDPEAVDLKKHLQKSVELMGFPEGTDMALLFSGMSNTIDNMRTQLDT